MTTPESTPALRRVLTLLDSTMVNVGTILGSGIFLVPALVAQQVDSSLPTLLLWVVGGVISLFGALSVAELGAAMPRTGGQFVYLQTIYGPVWGFLYGWAAFAVINTGAIAAVAVAFAEYLGFFIPLSFVGVKAVAVASIIILTALNTIGVKWGVLTQNVFTLVKIGAILAIILLGLFLPGGDLANFHPLLPTGSALALVGPLGLAMIAILWTYDGWIQITYMAGEVQRPERNIPLSLLLSTAIIIVIYLLINIVYILTLSLAGMAGSELVASDSAVVYLGQRGTVFVALAIIIATLGANNGNVLAGARISFAMARAGVFFNWAGRVHPRYKTPASALIIQGAWAVVLTLTGSFEQLITYVVFVSWIFYALSCGGVLILRRRNPELPRPYRTWGYPVVPAVFIIFALWLTGAAIISAPRDALIGIFILLAGLPPYYFWRRKG